MQDFPKKWKIETEKEKNKAIMLTKTLVNTVRNMEVYP